MPTVTDATTATFATEALAAPEGPSCSRSGPPVRPVPRAHTALEALAAERDDLKLVKVDTDEEQSLAAQYGVTGLPTVVILRAGRPVGTINQAAPKRRLAAQIDAALAA